MSDATPDTLAVTAGELIRAAEQARDLAQSTALMYQGDSLRARQRCVDLLAEIAAMKAGAHDHDATARRIMDFVYSHMASADWQREEEGRWPEDMRARLTDWLALQLRNAAQSPTEVLR